jgi:hypothetical protein
MARLAPADFDNSFIPKPPSSVKGPAGSKIGAVLPFKSRTPPASKMAVDSAEMMAELVKLDTSQLRTSLAESEQMRLNVSQEGKQKKRN